MSAILLSNQINYNTTVGRAKLWFWFRHVHLLRFLQFLFYFMISELSWSGGTGWNEFVISRDQNSKEVPH